MMKSTLVLVILWIAYIGYNCYRRRSYSFIPLPEAAQIFDAFRANGETTNIFDGELTAEKYKVSDILINMSDAELPIYGIPALWEQPIYLGVKEYTKIPLEDIPPQLFRKWGNNLSSIRSSIDETIYVEVSIKKRDLDILIAGLKVVNMCYIADKKKESKK